MRTRDPFGTALAGIRRSILAGRPPGEHLPVADLAADLRLSTSPVREALSRLSGEGLIEDRRGQGYFTRSLPVEDIVGLLRLERVHVELAAALAGVAAPSDATAISMERWIADLMATCDSAPLRESFVRVAERLASVRRLRDPQVSAPDDGRDDPIGGYYRQAEAEAPQLAARLRRLEPGAREYSTNTV